MNQTHATLNMTKEIEEITISVCSFFDVPEQTARTEIQHEYSLQPKIVRALFFSIQSKLSVASIVYLALNPESNN